MILIIMKNSNTTNYSLQYNNKNLIIRGRGANITTAEHLRCYALVVVYVWYVCAKNVNIH